MCINTYSLIERVCVEYPSYILSALTVSASSESPESLFSSVGIVKGDLLGRLLDT
jgi:hypothetical protein